MSARRRGRPGQQKTLQKQTPKVPCKFPRCQKEFRGPGERRKHLAEILAAQGDPEHPRNDPIWGEVDFSYQRRTKNMSEQEAKFRKNQSQKVHREKNKDQIKERRSGDISLKTAKELLRRMAKIASESMAKCRRLERPFDYEVPMRAQQLKRLYSGTDLVGDALDPYRQLRDLTETTIHIFPYLVSAFISPKDWPKITTSSEAQEGHSSLIMSQMPGDKEYRELQRMFHPDRGSTRSFNSNAHSIPGVNGPTNAIHIPRYHGTFGIEPNTAVDATLNAAYDLWKDVIRNPDLANETYLSDIQNPSEFSARSESHAKLMKYFDIWCHVSMSVSNSMIPIGVPFAEIMHYINNDDVDPRLGMAEEEEEEEDLASSGDETNEFTHLAAQLCVEEALRATTRKRPGRPARRIEDEDSEEEDELEDEPEEEVIGE